MEIQQSPVSILLFIITIAISMYAWYGKKKIIGKCVLHPWSVAHCGQWWRIITSGFVHADFMHLMFNMFTFYFFAFQLEYIIGPLNFAILYFGSMAISSISTIAKNVDNIEYRSLGASGAISGVVFGSVLFNPMAKMYIMLVPIGIPAFIFALLYLAFCYWASKRSGDFINHEAHLWGAIAGLLLTIVLVPESISIFVMKLFK